MGLFTSANEKQLKKLRKIADKVEARSDIFAKMDDAELVGMTATLRERIKNGETLDDVLPEAYATVREASARVLGMRHFYVQILGGIALHQGRIAEMCTGEGKTLVATLPVYLNALEGKGVHVVTVNEYLATRDSEWMGKVYAFLGLTVGVVCSGMNFVQKLEAYACDIVYGTSNEFGFDYLRDNIAKRKEERVQRGFNFALVDEVDSILIDEARTPLIISDHGEMPEGYKEADRFAKKLTKEDYIIEEKERTVRLSESGIEKAEREYKIDNLSDFENSDINDKIYQALRANYIMKRDVNYIVHDNKVMIVDEFTGRVLDGRRFSEGLHQAIEAKENVPILAENVTIATITLQNYFRLYKKLSGMTGTAKTEQEEFEGIYGLDVVTIPTNKPSQRIDEPDVIVMTQKKKAELIVQEVKRVHETGQPVLIGTSAIDKNEELSKILSKNGLKHNVLNAKNHAEEADIIAQAGKLGAITIATNMAGRGTDIMLGGNPTYLAERQMEKENFTHEEIVAVSSPVFVPQSEEDERAKARYTELYQLYKEKTDKEREKVIEAGGLRIIGTERHESRRIDNQLRGRSGRQGDPGSSVFFVSVDDELLQRFGGDLFRKVFAFCKVTEDDIITSSLIAKQIESIQKRIESHNFAIRKNVLSYDDVVNVQREIIYKERDKIIFGENNDELLNGILDEYIEETTREILQREKGGDLDRINEAINRAILDEDDYIVDEELFALGEEEIINAVKLRAREILDDKKVEMEKDGYNFDVFSKDVLLYALDHHWRAHVDAMDSLKRGISLRAYGQQNPVIAYKQEGTDMFNAMMDKIKKGTAITWLKARYDSKRLQAKGPVMVRMQDGRVQLKAKKKIGPNDKCPCGSGLKYKKCCGKNQ